MAQVHSRRLSLLRSRRVLATAWLVASCLACSDPAQKQAEAEARARAEQAREAERLKAEVLEVAAAARRQAEEQVARAQAEAMARLKEQEATQSALSSCCDALARRGFEERSMPDMAAKRACLALAEKKTPLAEARSELTAALGERALPSACSAP